MKKFAYSALFALSALSPMVAQANTATTEATQAVTPKAQGIWIDVRAPEEYAEGHLQDAINIPHEQIVEKIAAVSPDKNAPVNLYCRSGRRSEIALKALKNAGYTNVINQGGYQDLLKKGLK